ncbi:formimidoylglutamase [Xanthovirga aplysinae]|uniref:formimidoylglutamase n=1 Tax=Xanthovirga aplysinae TaxID=2529853 RepID=UPI0012BCAEA3|nr:formimidoylglutamase [Xanthovirga aplysinae]MTI32435.1 formiminoglutamase [Xanthovirga aplysinae]
MDLHLFFSPVNEDLLKDIDGRNSLQKYISLNTGKMPEYWKADIALIGLEEERGTNNNKGVKGAANEIRKKFYQLKKGNCTYKVVDLGNLRNGVTLEETYLHLKEVCSALLEMGVLPLIIGGSHDLDFGQFQAYQGIRKRLTILNVDAKLDMEEGEEKDMSDKHIQSIFLHEPNYLFNFIQMGHQAYLTDPSSLKTLSRMNFEACRLGELRPEIREAEPLIRNADMLSFDVSAIKSGDAPANANSQVFGLTGEEACQICWYAGLNDKLSSAGFYEYNPDLDDAQKRTASVIAIMIWYFIEGFYHRKGEFEIKEEISLKYVVALKHDGQAITFYKSKLSQKWWMEVPYSTPYTEKELKYIIPCSYSDYQMATKGELPDRWLGTYSKLL